MRTRDRGGGETQLIQIPSQTLKGILPRLQQYIKLPLTLLPHPIHIPAQIRLRIPRTEDGDLRFQ